MKIKKYNFVSLVAILLLTGCSSQNENTGFMSDYENLNSSYKSDENLNQCMTESLNRCMTSIVTSKATSAMDVSLCDDLMNDDLKAECVGSIQLIQAIQETDITKCSGLSGDLFYNCEIDILNLEAQNKKDLDICEQIQVPEAEASDESVGYYYEERRKACINDVTIAIAVEKRDIEECSTLDDDSKTICEEQVATTKSADEERDELEKAEVERLIRVAAENKLQNSPQ